MKNKLIQYKYTFTVFTPAFNRAHTIERVYNSLTYQTFRSFEWLIVDDGSTDNTKEVIKKWKQEADFDIHYIYKPNGGKNTALNVGVNKALGEFFLILDSDDRCIPETLERFYFHWNSIPQKNRDEFSGVSVLCQDEYGKVIGNKYFHETMDISPIKLRSKYGIKGEKWGFHKTEIFREFPFPEIPNEKYVPEGIVWNRMAAKYKVRHINEMLRIYEFSSDGITASIIKTLAKSPKGSRMYYKEFINLPFSYILKLRNLINYIRYSFHGNTSLNKIIKESGYPFLSIIFLPVGFLMFKNDKLFKIKEK
jgi:glycosyltransferase involved in cell wall biosynthesis